MIHTKSNNLKDCIIQWKKEVFEAGKRKIPASLTLHSYIVVEQNAWSVVFNFDVAPHAQGYETVGTVKFLVENAPHEILKSGFEFPLYDGPTTIGLCIIF